MQKNKNEWETFFFQTSTNVLLECKGSILKKQHMITSWISTSSWLEESHDKLPEAKKTHYAQCKDRKQVKTKGPCTLSTKL